MAKYCLISPVCGVVIVLEIIIEEEDSPWAPTRSPQPKSAKRVVRLWLWNKDSFEERVC